MRGEHTGRGRGVIGAGGRRIGELAPERALDRRARQAAGPQQHRFAEAGDDGRFDADRRRAAVDDEIDAAAEIGQHVVSRGRRQVAGAVGRGRDHGLAEGPQNIARHVVVGHPHGDGVEPGRRQVGDRTVGGFGENERERSRPERGGEPRRVGIKTAERLRRLQIRDMGDERVEGRAAFGLVDPRDGAPVGRVGAEAVDGLGRKGDQAAGGEHARRVGDRCGIGLRYAGDQRSRHGCLVCRTGTR